MCEPCPVGTYYKNGDCVFCPSGTYSKKGTTKCKNMPLTPLKDYHCNSSGYCTFTNFFQIHDEQIVDLLIDFEKNFNNNSKWIEVNFSGTKHTLSRGLYKMIHEEYNSHIFYFLVEREATIRFSNDRKFEGINNAITQSYHTFKKLYKYKF